MKGVDAGVGLVVSPISNQVEVFFHLDLIRRCWGVGQDGNVFEVCGSFSMKSYRSVVALQNSRSRALPVGLEMFGPRGGRGQKTKDSGFGLPGNSSSSILTWKITRCVILFVSSFCSPSREMPFAGRRTCGSGVSPQCFTRCLLVPGLRCNAAVVFSSRPVLQGELWCTHGTSNGGQPAEDKLRFNLFYHQHITLGHRWPRAFDHFQRDWVRIANRKGVWGRYTGLLLKTATLPWITSV